MCREVLYNMCYVTEHSHHTSHITPTHVHVLGEVVVAARGEDSLELVPAPAEEGGKAPADGDDPGSSAHDGGLALGQLGAVEAVADDVVPVEGDHAQRPDAAHSSHSTCGERG